MNQERLVQEKFNDLLKSTGIKINGKNPWDIQIHDKRFYDRVIREGSLGLGESYMDGWWDCDQLDEFISRILKYDIQKAIKANFSTILTLAIARILNLQSRERSLKVAKEHYDLDTVLFEKTLDKNMQYTCGYWKEAKNLDDAQIAKMDLICQKLDPKPGITLLDVGSGWGQLANFAAEKYGVKATGITISKEQLKFCQENYSNKNLKFLLRDYRDMEGQFDRIVSVGMIEHVGHKNYQKFMEIVSSLLTDDGLFLLHTIGNNKSSTTGDPWLTKYIFPNGMLPSVKQLARATEGLFVMEDWHSFGSDYDKTLMAWMNNFDKNWPSLKKKYDDRFYRMWRYYLLMCAGTFRSRKVIQLWQIVYSQNGVPGGYQSSR